MENLQMLFVNNEPDQIELRKSRNTLRIVGSGIIIFGAWSAIKMMALLFLFRKETVDSLRNDYELAPDVSDGIAFWVITIVVFILLAVILSIRAYIGLSAIAEGRGKRKGIIYLLPAVVMIVLNAMSVFTGITRLGVTEQQAAGPFTQNQTVSALIIDATSTIMIIEMVVSSIKVKILTRKKRRGGK